MNDWQQLMYEQQMKLRRGAEIIEGKNNEFRRDGYSNMLNKVGTKQDNSMSYSYNGEPAVDDMTLIRLYEGNGLFTKIIDRPSEEAVKHGLDIDFGDEDILEYVEDRLDDLGFEAAFATAEKWARLYGGSIIVMLIDDGRGLEEPVDWRNARGIAELRVFERAIVQPDYTALNTFHFVDSMEERRNFGKPVRYNVSSIYGSFTVHHSRCLVFKNGTLPEQTTNANYRYWGMPEYVKISRALRECITSHEDGVKLLERSVQAIYKMKNLSNLLATNDGEDMVIKRLQVIDMARSIINSIAIDTDGEEYNFETLAMAGVKDVIDSTCNMLSAVTNIPQTILFGRSPAGMNSTGENDMENYYNMVENIQKQNMKANARKVIELILKQGFLEGRIKEVPKFKVKFSALWSMSEAETADVENKKASTQLAKAQTAEVYINAGVLDPSEIRNTIAAEGTMEIEAVLSDADELELPEDTFGTPTEQAGASEVISILDDNAGDGGIISVSMLEDIANKKGISADDEEIISIQDAVNDAWKDDIISIDDGGGDDVISVNTDGGPGSGNWGHEGVPGKVGGSAGGGGVKNRKGSKEAGFTSEAKERAEARKGTARGKMFDSSKCDVYNWGNNISKAETDKLLTLAGANVIQPDKEAKVTVRSRDYSSRVLIETEDAEVLVKTNTEKNSVLLDSIFLKDTGTGKGTEVIKDIAENAKKQGYSKLTATGAGVKGDHLNGYYTLPRLGFDGPLTSTTAKKAKEAGFNVTTVGELMRSKRGRNWWKENGHAIELEFDLSEGSSSFLTMNDYIREKGKRNEDGARYPASAVLILNEGKVLCASRRNSEGLCGPGGKSEDFDGSNEATARREAMEEFNVVPHNLIPLGVYESSSDLYLSSMVYFTDEFEGTPEADGNEMINEQWLSIPELREKMLFPPFEASLDMLENFLGKYLTTDDSDATITTENYDGPGKGNHGHGGRPGKVGGSSKGNKSESTEAYNKALLGIKTSKGKTVKKIDPHMYKQAKIRDVYPSSIAEALKKGKTQPGNKGNRTVYSYKGTFVVFDNDESMVITAVYKGK